MHGGSEQGVSKTMGAPKREGAKHAQSWVQRGRQQTCLGLGLLAAYASTSTHSTSVQLHGRAFARLACLRNPSNSCSTMRSDRTASPGGGP